LNGGKLLQHRAWSQSRCQHPQPSSQLHMQTIGQKGDKNMRLDPALQLMKDWAQAQIVFEVFEGAFHLRQLHIKLPQSRRVLRSLFTRSALCASTYSSFSWGSSLTCTPSRTTCHGSSSNCFS